MFWSLRNLEDVANLEMGSIHALDWGGGDAKRVIFPWECKILGSLQAWYRGCSRHRESHRDC